MGPDDADKFAGADDFGFLPELWEMALIAGDQVVRAGGIGAFEENVIGGVGRDLKRAGGRDEMGPMFFRRAFFPYAPWMMRSIWREERDAVPLRRDSSPMARRTAG